MIEKKILDYLSNKIDTPCFMERQKICPKSYVLIEKIGSTKNNYINRCTIAIQSYDETMYGASLLNEKVKNSMENIIELNDIGSCRLKNDYNFTDTAMKKYRYQAVFEIVYY